MSYYRVYSLCNDGTHFVDFDQFDADGDTAAILKVKIGEVGVSRELWNLGRKVMDFSPRIAVD